MKVDVHKISGEKSGKKVELQDRIFKVPQNEHVVYQVVKAHLANRRQGTHAAKNRALVSGGGKKPWKQKGRGVARAGTNRSPLWVGGGRVFGPEPRDYRQKINKKVKKLARRSVLSHRLAEKRLFVVEDFSLESGKTREMLDILLNFEVDGGKALFLLKDFDANILRACKNLPDVSVLRADLASTYDLLRNRHLFIQQGAIAKLEEILS